MSHIDIRHILLSTALAFVLLPLSPGRPYSEEPAGTPPDSSWTLRWGGSYSSLIELDDSYWEFPWNDSSHFYDDRVSLMFEAAHNGGLHLFLKGATGRNGYDGGVYNSRFHLEQGHLSATWREALTGKLFLNERIFRNRNRLVNLVSNDSRYLAERWSGIDAGLIAAGPVRVSYTGAFLDRQYQREYFIGLPSPVIDDDILHLFEAGIDRIGWHAGITAASVWDTWIDDKWYNYYAMYGIDGGIAFAGGRLNLEYARTAPDWDSFDGGLFGIDTDSIEWGDFSAALPDDAVLAAEWTGFEWDGGDAGRFGLIPGYRYSGRDFDSRLGYMPGGHIESYAEAWWKHARLASILAIKAADRFDYSTGYGGMVLEGSIWNRWKGGLETTARGFFAEGSRPSLILSTVDDNSLTRLTATARVDDTGGENTLSFLTEATVKLGGRWSLGGSVYLDRSREGFYTAGVEFRGGRRFVFRATTGTYDPESKNATLNFDPSPRETRRDKVIAFYTRVWLGGI